MDETLPPDGLAALDDDGFDAWLGMWKAHTLVIREIENALREAHAPSVAACEVLSRLAAAPEGRLQMHELARRCFVTRSGISQLVSQLAKTSLVERQSDPTNLRTTYAAITDAGLDALARHGPVFLQAIRRNFTDHLSTTDVARLLSITRTLVEGHGAALESDAAPPAEAANPLRDLVARRGDDISGGT